MSRNRRTVGVAVGLVRISATCSSEGTKASLIIFDRTTSLSQWYLTSTCLEEGLVRSLSACIIDWLSSQEHRIPSFQDTELSEDADDPEK